MCFDGTSMLQRTPTSRGQTLHRNRCTVCWLADANSWKGQDVRTLQFARIVGFWSTNSNLLCGTVIVVNWSMLFRWTALTSSQLLLNMQNSSKGMPDVSTACNTGPIMCCPASVLQVAHTLLTEVLVCLNPADALCQ